MEIVGLLVLGFAGVVVGGSICGIIAVVRTHSMRIDLEQLQRKVHCLESRVWADPERKTSQQKEGAAETAAGSPPPISVQKEVPPVSAPVAGKDTPPLPPVPAASTPPASAQAAAPLSFEMRLGTRWIIWLGAAIFLGGVALALKYSYDNSMIGPNGRMVMGVLTGVIALFAGEYFERRKRVIPFQVFTGGGLAIFYLCIFFAFQIYHLTGSGFAMLLAVIVTVLAVSLSVLHNAMPIAMLAVLGGYLSPVFLSTGENAPWQLFSYVAVLNMVALGAGYFRRWRMLDLFCFAGTAFLYLGWYEKFYSYPGQVAPALIFITLFYMMFMIVPVLYSLVRGIPEGLQSLTLIMGNSLFWLFCYYSILFEAHREALGLVALMQALFVFLLYNLWTRRVKDPTPTAQSLLVISLSLLTLVIPLWLHFYAVPLAWAVEGVVLLWLSFRFRNRLARLGGVLALGLAVVGLLYYLPLHDVPFMPLFNTAFGAWAFVAAAIVCGAGVLHKKQEEEESHLILLTGGLALTALVLTCFLLTVETFQYWQLQDGQNWFVNASASLIVLWTVIPALLVYAVVLWQRTPLVWAAEGAYAFSLLVFLFCIGGMEKDTGTLMLNVFFLPRLIFLLALWQGIAVLKKEMPFDTRIAVRWLELAGYAYLALLSCIELIRWGKETEMLSSDMAVGMVSAVWAFQACALIWYGLITRNQLRRYAGFVLFAVTVGKTVFVDVFELEAVYRIVSWLGVGMLLVVASLLYQKYSVLLLAEDSIDTESPPKNRKGNPE